MNISSLLINENSRLRRSDLVQKAYLVPGEWKDSTYRKYIHLATGEACRKYIHLATGEACRKYIHLATGRDMFLVNIRLYDTIAESSLNCLYLRCALICIEEEVAVKLWKTDLMRMQIYYWVHRQCALCNYSIKLIADLLTRPRIYYIK